MTHLHIAFAASGATISIVARDAAGHELGRQSDMCDGAHAEWKAALLAVQYAVAQGAERITLYSHHADVMAALELRRVDHSGEYRHWAKGRTSGSTPIAEEDDALVWRIALMSALFSAFLGRWDARRISAERNVAMKAIERAA